MKLTFLGVGGAFAGKDQYQSNMIVDYDGYKLLIDSGQDLKHSLAEAGYKVEDLDGIYISHLHRDHSDLEYLGFYSYFISRKKLDLFVHESLVDLLWIAHYPSMRQITDKDMKLGDYFNVHAITDEKLVSHEQLLFVVHKNLHVRGENNSNMYSFGISFMPLNTGKLIYISTDSLDCFATYDLVKYHPTDNFTIFHDCDVYSMTEVHTHYDELKKMPKRIKKNTWLYHYSPKLDSPWEHQNQEAQKDGFAGFVQKGQSFNF